MAELRSIDPRTLVPNPNNPRKTPAPPAMDDQLFASIKAVGLIQPPRVRETDAGLVIVAGDRRRQQAIRAELPSIDVLVCDPEEAADAMRSVSENLIRASMTSVDIWRATEALEKQGWNEGAIADALALPSRTVRRLKLLAHLHPAMLDVMATGSMPNEDQLRTIAAATREEQKEVWKKHKPRKGHDVAWFEVARALSKRRIPFAAAKFGDDLAAAYGVTWHDDLFAPAGEDSRYTMDVEGFFGAQQEWLQANLPEGGTLLPADEYGSAALPRKAQPVYGKPGKGDQIGHYLDPHSGEVKTAAYRLPEAVKPKAGSSDANSSTRAMPDDAPPARTRPNVTQKGCAMIGDLRTDALHQALQDAEIDDQTLLALLVLAFAGQNVTVQSGTDLSGSNRIGIARPLAEGGVLSADAATTRAAARAMLAAVLSCRENMSNSGLVARVAGDAIGASLCLPNMATEEFLSCVSKPALERAAAAEGVRVEVRGKDTRARMVERFKTGTYVYPAALFKLTEGDLAKDKAAAPRRYVPGEGWVDPTRTVAGDGRSANADVPDGFDGIKAGEALDTVDADDGTGPGDVGPMIPDGRPELASYAAAAD